MRTYDNLWNLSSWFYMCFLVITSSWSTECKIAILPDESKATTTSNALFYVVNPVFNCLNHAKHSEMSPKNGSNLPSSKCSQIKNTPKSAKISPNHPKSSCFFSFPSVFQSRSTWQLTPECVRQLQLMLLQRLRQVPGGGGLATARPKESMV